MGAKLLLLTATVALFSYGLYRCIYSTREAPKLEAQWWGPGEKPVKEDTSIRPFKIQIPDKDLADLKRRLDNARLPSPPLERVHFQYGFNSHTLAKILNFWRTEYNWRARETYLNKYPQFKTNIQGLDIHYIHVKPTKTPPRTKTTPILLLHGWPGSVREFYSLIELMGTLEKFEIVVPSLPGYGFSSPAVRPGMGTAQMAIILRNLMNRLGYNEYIIQGGDWGSQIATNIAILYPGEVKGLHLNLCIVNSMKQLLMTALVAPMPSLFMSENYSKRLYPMSDRFGNSMLETGYLHLQATKPDTLGAGLADSPIGLAAYILEKFSTGTNFAYRAIKDGGLTNQFTYTDLLDNVMIYWLTNSMTPAMRIYAEHFLKENRDLGMDLVPVTVPTWCALFPGELAYLPTWMLRTRYPKVIASEMPAGGHFAAMEKPKEMLEDILRAVKHFEKA